MEYRVLVASPTFDGMKYCQKQFIEKIKHLSYPKYDILLVDNSRNEEYFKELFLIQKIKVIHDNTNEEKSIYRLISSRNLIIEHALNNNYSHILMIDSDIIPPQNIIEELLSTNKDIVSGIYYNYFNIDGENKWLPVAWKYLTIEQFNEMKRLYPQFSHIKNRTNIRRHLTEQEVNSKELHEVVMLSTGCMLISRKVFEKVRFGKFENSNSKTGEDTYFIEKSKEQGFRIYCNTKIKCDHLVEGKYIQNKDGNLIHSGFSDLI